VTADVVPISGVLGQPAIDIEDNEVTPEDRRYWSVTEILKAIGDPGGLLHWSAEEAAKAAVNQRATWQAMEQESGTTEAVSWLTNARYRTPKGQRSASKLGDYVHDLCEEYALTGVRPDVDDEGRPYLDQFDRWCQRAQPTYLAAEMSVFSPTYGYAGTCDAILQIDGVTFCADYKSTRRARDRQGRETSPYADSVGLQVCAYARAEIAAVWRARRTGGERKKRYYWLNATEQAMGVPLPQVDMGLAVHITPEHCEAFPLRVDDDVFEDFLHAFEVAGWIFERSKRVMSEPLTYPDRSAS
jgi:hypothetical protein